MDFLRLYFLVFTISLFVYVLLWRKKKNTRSLSLPPGPPAWPIVGNLLQVGRNTNEILFALSQQHGPLMTLRLGMKTIVVVSSSAMAKEVLKTHDHIFAGRPIMALARAHDQHKSAMAPAEYGPHWRKVRRIATTELFSPKRLQALQHLRRDQVFQTMRLTFEEKGKSVNIGRMVFIISMNLLGNMVFSKSVFDPHNPASVEFKDTIWTLMKLAATPNLADFFPFLAPLDPQRILSRTATLLQKMYDFFDVFIQDRLATGSKLGDGDKDFLDVLLDYRSEDFSLKDIRILVAELFMAGSDTTATTIEWAMAELLHSPQILKLVQAELEQVVGLNRRVEESDIDQLPYFRAVVKEVFRMHPAVPLMIPHRAESTCEVAGFMIPKHTTVIVNSWGIGRDPAVWKNPSKFSPERFFEGENSKMDYKGQNFDLIPFGAGRRMCVGLPLASRMVHLVLASLLHSFDWALPYGMSGMQLDMTDEFGLTLKKAVDLDAVPTPRLPHYIY